MGGAVIKSVEKGSPARRAGIRPGEALTAVNGHPIADVLDYKYYSYDTRLALTLQTPSGRVRRVRVYKDSGEDLGLEFETYLMDKVHSCANRCVFCFVDQLPPGLRDTLYFKDDDARMSFLMGNYITMTNLSEREVKRIIELRISPINISVHATDPNLRTLMLGNKNAGRGLETMRRFAGAGIVMNCQIVACPGLNDGAALQSTMEDLARLCPSVRSVSIVPVGLTKYRQGLYPLRPYARGEAAELVEMVERFGEKCLSEQGTTMFWCSDEFYLKAAKDLPAHSYYEEYTQLENGVGMLRLLETEFIRALEDVEEGCTAAPFSVATGVAAAPFLREMIDRVSAKCHTELEFSICPVINHFFGESIDVAGLVTGGDLIGQLREKELGKRLLLPVNMLRHGEELFLDGVTLSDVSEALGVPVVAVAQDGYELLDAILDKAR